MEQIVYVSTARGLRPTGEEIEEILRVSRFNNDRDDLTGLLIVGGRRFLQVLEGPSGQLDRAYARIKVDPRHFALVELSRHAIQSRSFAEWNMGYEAAGSDSLSTMVDQLTERVSDPALQAHLRSFAALHSTTA